MVGAAVGGLLAAFDAVMDGLAASDFEAFAPVPDLIGGLTGVSRGETPPPWLDEQRRPRRNTAHHLPELQFATVV